MSSLSEMRSLVNEQRRLNNELTSELNTITNGINSAYNRWNNLCNSVSNTMSNGASRVKSSHDAITAAYELQGEIDKMYVLFKNIELANKKIRACNNRKIYDFANYSAVRKIVTAILDNLEMGLVSDATITKAVEIKHLQLPDYWLTCALLSLMAWRNDDREFAEHALARACQLDKKNCAVFFLVFNIRMGRETAALKWFEYYQTCELTGDDQKTFLILFFIVSEAITQNCSATFVSEIKKFINHIVEENMKSNGYNEEEMINRIFRYTRRYVPNETIDYPVLSKYCLERDLLNLEMVNAKANIGILDFILKTVNVTDKEKKDYLNNFIIELVGKPNSVEIEVEDEIKYNEYIISNQGDIEAAKSEFEAYKSHRENSFDIILEMLDWIYKSGVDDVNPMVKRNLFVLTKELNKKSFLKHINVYRSSFKNTYKIKINDYETIADFKNESGECSKFRAFIDDKKNKLLSHVKMWPSFICFGGAVIAGVGAIAIPAYALFVLTAIGALAGGGVILGNNIKRKQISIDCENEYVAGEAIIKNIISDYNQYLEKYNEYDSYAKKIEEEMDKL